MNFTCQNMINNFRVRISKHLLFYCLVLSFLGACQTNQKPFSPILTQTKTLSVDATKFITPHINTDLGLATSTSEADLTAGGKTIHRLTMTALFQLDRPKYSNLYASLLNGMKVYLEETGSKVSAVVQDTGNGIGSFSYAYAKGGTTGLLQVWGVAGKGNDFHLFVSIIEN